MGGLKKLFSRSKLASIDTSNQLAKEEADNRAANEGNAAAKERDDTASNASDSINSTMLSDQNDGSYTLTVADKTKKKTLLGG